MTWQQVLELGQRLHAIEGTPGLEQLQETVLQVAEETLQARARLWLSGLFKPEQEAKRSEPENELMRCALEEGKLCYYGGDGEPRYLPAWEMLADDTFRIAAPLVSGSAQLGALEVVRPDGRPFSGEDAELLRAIVLQTTHALEDRRQRALVRWRREQLALVRKVGEQIAGVRDLDELSRRVTRLILDTFNYYFVAVFTSEPADETLTFRSSAGPRRSPGAAQDSVGEDGSTKIRVRLGEGIIGLVAISGEEILARDVREEPRYRYTDVLPETLSEVALPLTIEGRVLGVLDVQSDERDDFAETDLLVLRALAGYIAVAIEGARLYQQAHRRAEQLSIVSEVSNAISSILDLEELLSEVTRLLQRHFGYPFVHIFSVHPGRRKVFYEAGSAPESEQLREDRFAYDLDDHLGIIPWVARNGETLLANDVGKEPLYRASNLPPANTRSELTVPLIFGGEVLGVLDVESERENAFGEDDVFLFEALADTIAVALRNATLYRSELWRRQVADSLREVAGLLSAEADLDQVLDVILTELERTLPCDAAAIWLADPEAPDDEELHLAALRGGVGELPAEFNIGISLSQAARLFDDPQKEPLTSWLHDVLHAGEPVVRHTGEIFEPLGAALGFPADYSAIATPLKAGENRLGVLTLAHNTPGRYGTESRAMVAAFASYAAVAIQNTRLYEAAHEQAWVSTVLLQVSSATQSITNLHELLATVVRITPMLTGVRGAALYLVDDDSVFLPAAAYGLDKDSLAEFERWRFAPGDVDAFDHLTTRGHALILYGENSDPLLTSIFAGKEQPGGGELLVMVPLLSHEDVIGALIVDYAGDFLNISWREDSLFEIFDERLAILQGIAHQTAQAVENIRLLRAQKEEAYVSVALLQVAQAVVSSNELDETIAAIVRITPILTGVQRAALFLWDSEEQLFFLAEEYGIPRNDAPFLYSPDNFPLLAAVLERNSMIAYPVDVSEQEPPDTWTQITPPETELVDLLLQSDQPLLMAFPLSVVSQRLGVLLVEEPDSPGGDGLLGASVRRVREKRLEITTGISQQAALAIQNAQLQQETVERERLEREIQLAREIQRTFLPQTLPVLPGWDLQARWRTAREVGGDFYDVFDLPDGRLGIVIADVADKGMPAALFMVLSRTLIRANVQTDCSPGEVLSRVNEVILPDTENGMFLTVVYGVLDLESGDFEYANAGHNPPLLVRVNRGEVESLGRTSMALGVLDSLNVGQSRVRLNPGDYLLLYTDGLTEAFSKQGDMYGQKRVLEELQAICPDPGEGVDTAEQLLDEVENSLREFVADTPLADDLTLVALKREQPVKDA